MHWGDKAEHPKGMNHPASGSATTRATAKRHGAPGDTKRRRNPKLRQQLNQRLNETQRL